ncbi:MAG: sulfite exporter TauE/SafE family protein [Planctomycetes bacterium]|nr:sulfite exporter TauE/SafE family protein [Planctomycetota bacterium]
MLARDAWPLFVHGWPMSVTMAFGSFVAGATSEGGGAVAFPVMTLLLGIEPSVARDFSLMVQSIGMTSASVTILATGIRVERHAVVWGSLGGTLGIVLGLEFVADLLSASSSKMLFTSIWLAFAVALFMINRYHEREVHHEIANFLPRHALLLFATGVVGGVVSSITGSGLDITIFSLLVLRLRINESVATPTSVVLMAVNSMVGFLWKGGVHSALATEAWESWWVCVPIVVVGAPVGAWFIRHRSRLFVSGLLYVAIGLQSVAAFLIVPQTAGLLAFSATVFAVGTLFFRGMAARGVRRLEWLATADGVVQAGDPGRPGRSALE